MGILGRFFGSHPLSRPVNKAGTETDIDAHLAAESRTAEQIERAVKEALHMLRDIKRAEKGFKKIDDLLELAMKQKRNIENWYDQRIIIIRKRGDVAQEQELKHQKYWQMAKVNRSLYASLKKAIANFSFISEADKRFEQANKLINQELDQLANDVRVEFREEVMETRA